MKTLTSALRGAAVRPLLGLTLFAHALTSGPASAVDLYFDPDADASGNSTDGAGLGGAGSWDSISSNWWNGSGLTSWSNALTDNAIFTYAFPTSPYAIPVSTAVDVNVGGVSANRLTFLRSGYTLTGGAITLGGTNAGIFAGLGESATISAQISGTAGLLVTGGGTIRLTNSSNDYTGLTSISNGTLIISNPAQLGADTSALQILTTNRTPLNTTLYGFGGGSLVLDGTTAGFTFSRDVDIEGRGPIGERGSAIVSLGNNTLSGTVSAAVSPLPLSPTATIRNSRINSVNGILTLSGTLNVGGTAGTTVAALGGVNGAGVGNFDFTGVLSGTGTLEKSGGGTLFLTPSDTSGFSGRVRVSASATGTQSSVRVSSVDVFGSANGGTTSAPIDMNGGVLELRSDSSLDFGKNVYQRASSTIFVGQAVGGSGVNGTATFGSMAFEDNLTNTFNSRNGYGVSFTTAPVVGTTAGDNNSTITNNMGGTLSFAGNFWSNANNTANRVMFIGGNGNTVINGNVIASAAAFDHSITKTGVGSLTITGTGSTLDGSLNSNGGAVVITDFRSLNMHAAGTNTGLINIGTGTTAGALIIGTGIAPTAAGLTTNKTINFAGTTGGVSLYANQSGTAPVILNGAITATGGTSGNAKTVTLGGTNTADNIINGIVPNNAAGGTVNLLKIGSGTWVLSNANTYTGATTIQNGTLKLRATAAASDVIGSAAGNTIVFSGNTITGTAGGGLEFTGFSGAATTETLGALTPTAGASTVRIVGNGGFAANLTFTSLGATAAASSLNFDTSGANGGVITLTGQAATSATNLPGTANFQGHLYINGADFATIDGSAQVVAPTYSDSGNFREAASALTASFHNKLTGSFSNAAATVSSLVTNSQTLTMSGNLTISTGGILQSGGTASILSDSGTARLILGGAAATNIAFRVDGGSDVLNIGSAANPVNIGSAQTGGLTKNGAGKLVFYGTNAQTGTVNINEGTIELNGTNARLAALAGVATVIRQNAFLDFDTAVAFAANPTVTTLDGAGTIRNIGSADVTLVQTGSGTWAGSFDQTGSGVLNVSKLGTTGAPIWRGLSNYTGVTTIGGTTGSVTVDFMANIGEDSGIGRGLATDDATNAASLVFSATGATPGGLIYRGDIIDGALTLGSRSVSTDRLFTVTGSGLTLGSTQTTNLNNAIVWSNPGAIVHDGTAQNRTFIFTGTSQGDNIFTPQITDPAGFATGVTKTGTGIWHLRAANNTYSGATIITQGILGATNNEGLSANSNLQFNGGTLYSQGTFTRNIGTGAGEMQFLAPAANTAQFSGGFLGGDSKLTVNWAGTPVWGGGAGFLDTRNGILLNGSQASGQGATGSIALSEVEIAGNFSLGMAANTNLGPGHTFAIAQNSSTVTVASTAGLAVGQSITGTNIPSGAYIISVLSATTFQMSANTANASGIAGTYADGAITGGNLRAIRVDDNGNTGADFATISGVISAGDSVTGIRKLGTGILKLTGANTYEGETSVYQGTLVVTSLGRSGTAGTSSVGAVTVGAFTDANAVTLGNGGTGGGILQYVGAGEISDRKIRLNSTTGGNQIHADGSGPLILTNVVNDMTVGNKTLSLRGSNAAGNMITSQLSDFGGGVLSIGVDGGATWILTNGTNNYSGVTTVGAGALGIGHNAAIGGALTISNGNVFAYGGDRALTNTLNLGNNATSAFIGDYSLTFNGTNNLAAAANNATLSNSIAAGKTLTFNGLLANSLTANRTWTMGGNGETVINGAFTTSTSSGVAIVHSGNGVLNLGTNGAGSNWNQNNANIDLDRGTLKFSADEAIPTASAANGGLVISPELETADTATVDLNGTAQTVNALTATTNGAVVIDNTSASAATFRFGANNAAVNFGSGIGTYTIQNTGAGALSLVKLGNTSVSFISGLTLAHAGITASEGGGVFSIASPLTATSGLRAIGESVLALSGGITNPGLITSVEVGGGSTLSLLDGAGSNIANLATLSLGNTGTGTVTLNLNVGDLNTNTDRLNTDTLTLLAGGVLDLGNTITFNLTDAGLNAGQTYTLLSVADGGLEAFGLGKFLQGATPGGFDSMTWFVDNNVVQLTTGTLLLNDLYWRGSTDNTWNGALDNWSLLKDGTGLPDSIPGQGNKVIFSWDDPGAGPLVTTLEQNFKVNSLVFEAGADTTPLSVSINPGALATARLEVAPSSAANGISIASGGPAAVIIGANLKIGANQTWDVADSGSTLTLSGALFGEANVTKDGAGKVILSGTADPTFNSGKTVTFTVEAGNLEFTNTAAFGTTANSNVASIVVNGGGFYYNNGTAGTALTLPHSITLDGGALSGGGANHVYGGTVTVNGASTINLADSNGAPSATARGITLAGGLTGTGNLTVNGNDTASAGNQIGGTLTLNQDNSAWSGNWNILRGSISTNNENGFGSGGTITAEKGRLLFTGTAGSRSLGHDIAIASATENAVLELNQASGIAMTYTGQVTLGGAGGTGELRFIGGNDAATATFTGGVELVKDGLLSVRNATLRLMHVDSEISETGGPRSLRINDGAWGGTAGTVRLTGANTFSGNVAVARGILEFNTVTNSGGAASSLGQGSIISIAGVANSTLRFIGNGAANSQTTDRAINVTPETATNRVGTLDASGTNGASITYAGPITVTPNADTSWLVLSGLAGSQGFITGGITQTGTTADVTVNGGTWALSGTQSTIADDLFVIGTGAVLNLDSTDVVRLMSGGGGADLNIRSGGVVNINASNAIQYTGSNYRLLIGQGADGADATLNLNANLLGGRLILGERGLTRVGVINGPGTLTIDNAATDFIQLYRGEINANLASSGTGAGIFRKLGSGTVTLRGDNSGLTNTGINQIDNGILVLDYTLNNATKLNADRALDMRGAELRILGNASADTLQTVASFTMASGAGNNIIDVTAGTGRTATLALGAITRTASLGTLRINLNNVGAAVTTGTGNTNGIVGTAAYTTVKDPDGTWFGTNDGGSIVALASTAKNDVAAWLSGEHITDETTGFTGPVVGSHLSSLRFDAAGGSALNFAPGGVLTIASGGVLITDQVTSGAPGLFGGTLGTGVAEIIVTQDSSQVFEISSRIGVNNAFTKTGPGTVLLSGNNAFTGTVSIQNGVLQLAGGNALPDVGSVVFAANRNSVLELLADENLGRLSGGQRATNSDYGQMIVNTHTLGLNVTSDVNFDGVLVGSGTIVKTGANFQGFRGISTGFTGDIVINQGGIQLSISGQINASSFTINKNGALEIANTGNTVSLTRILDTTPIILNSADGAMTGTGAAPRLGLTIRNDNNSARNETIGNLVFNSGANYLSGDANVGSGNARAAILALDFVRNDSATVAVRARNLGRTTTHNIQFRISNADNQTAFINSLVGGGGAVNTATISIVPWAIGETHDNAALAVTNMGNSLVTYVSGAGFRPLDLTTEYATYATAGANNNTRQSLTADLTDLAGRTLNSLVIHNNNTAASAINVTGTGAGQTLTNTSGAFLFTLNPTAAASSAHAVSLGGFDDGIAVGGSEYLFYVVNPSSAATTATLTTTISSNLVTAADLTKSGRGTLVLAGTNTAGGGARKTTINEGVLEIGSLANIGGGTGGLVFAGGTLRLGAGFIDDLSTRTISYLLGGGTIDTNGIDVTLANSLGSGLGGFTKTGDGNLTLNGTAAFAGAVTLSGGTITIGANNALGVGGDLTLAGGTTLDLGTSSLAHGLVTTVGVSPAITGTGTITANSGFVFNHTGDTTIGAVLAGAGGIFKLQANVITLTGLSTYTGTTEVRAGGLVFDSISNVGGGASALGNPGTVEDGIIRMGLTTAATTLTYTGTGHLSDRLIGMQGTTGTSNLSLFGNGTGAVGFGGVRFETPGNKTLILRGTSDAIHENQAGGLTEVGGVLTLTKSDANTWAVTGESNYTGATTVQNGILRFTADKVSTAGAITLGTASTAGALELTTGSASFTTLSVVTNSTTLTNNLVVDADQTLTLGGNVTIGANAAASTTLFTATGDGSFVNTNDGGTFQVGGAAGGTNVNAATADFSGLATFTVNLGSTGLLRIGDNTSVTGGTAGTSTLILGANSTITANLLQVASTQTDSLQTLRLGSGTNLLNVNTLTVGGVLRSDGLVNFAAGTGTVQLRAADGTSAAAVNIAAHTGNTANNNTATVDLAGHSADLFVSTLTMADRTLGTGFATATFSFDEGTLDVANLTMARRTSTGTGNATATMNLGGGTAVFGSTIMAVNTSGGGAVAAELNVSGGDVTFGTGSGTAINMANAAASRTVTSTMNLTGGNVTVTGNIVRQGGAGTENASIVLDGAVLDLDGNSIGSAVAPILLTAQSGTLRDLGELNGGGDLTKTGTGILVLEGANNYTGRTVVAEGTLSVSSEENLGANPVAFGAAHLEIDGGTLLTTASFTIDDAHRGITIGASGGAINVADTTTLTVGNAMVLNGDFTKSGDGVLLFNGSSTGDAVTVTVANGALGGTGTISADTNIVSSGAYLTAGNVAGNFAGDIYTPVGPTSGDIGTLTFGGDLNTATGSFWLIDLIQDSNGSSDLISVMGNLGIDGTSLILNTSGAFVPNSGFEYTIATYTGSLSTTFNGLSEGDQIGNYLISYGTGSNSAITLTAVPEPGTLGLLGLGLGGFFVRRLRKRKAKD